MQKKIFFTLITLGFPLWAKDLAVFKVANVPAKALYITQPALEKDRLFVLNQKGQIHIIKNGKTQIGFHDGKTLIDEIKVSVGDTCVLQIPEIKILEVIKLEKGMNCLIVKGVNAGKIGKIGEIKEGTYSIPKSIDITFDERQVEIPARLVMPIGKNKPEIKIR